jgi:hypothetical protein
MNGKYGVVRVDNLLYLQGNPEPELAEITSSILPPLFPPVFSPSLDRLDRIQLTPSVISEWVPAILVILTELLSDRQDDISELTNFWVD